MEIKFLTNQPGPEGRYPINMYLSRETEQAKPALRKVPGLTAGYDFGGGSAVRYMYSMGNSFYTVTGTTVLKYDSNYLDTPQTLGTVGTFTNNAAYIAGDGKYIVVTDENGLYYCDTSAGSPSLTTVSSPPATGSVCYLNGYFFVHKMSDDLIYYSALNDPTSWPVTNVIHSNARGDNCTRVISDNAKIWAINQTTTEAFYITGDSSFPIQKIQGSVMEFGTDAPKTAVVLDNAMYFVDQHRRVIRTQNFAHEVVSTQELEADTVQGAFGPTDVGLGIIFEGNPWYVIVGYSTYNKTWAYSPVTNSWFQWSYGTSGGRSLFASHCFLSGVHIVGKYNTGEIYRLSSTEYTNDDDPIMCQRVTPMISNEGKRIFFHSLQLDMLSGIGASTADTCTLAWSDDYGQNWSSEHTGTLQSTGDFEKRIIWRRLGSSRQRMFRLTYTGDESMEIYGAYLNASSGVS